MNGPKFTSSCIQKDSGYMFFQRSFSTQSITPKCTLIPPSPISNLMDFQNPSQLTVHKMKFIAQELERLQNVGLRNYIFRSQLVLSPNTISWLKHELASLCNYFSPYFLNVRCKIYNFFLGSNVRFKIFKNIDMSFFFSANYRSIVFASAR